MAQILDGKATAKNIRAELKEETEKLKEQGVVPGLAAVLIGDNPASEIYVSSKQKACNNVGFYSEVIRRPKEFTQSELNELVRELNDRKDIHGILVQEPLPSHLSSLEMIMLVSPIKDVDGFHPASIGMMLLGRPSFIACTPLGIIELLRRFDISPSGKDVVILGRGNIVGKPLAVLLQQKWKGSNATVTLCHTGTKDIASHTRRAEILIAAMGVPEFVKGDMISDGCVIVDVGTNRVEDASAKKGYRVVGDVEFDSCEKKASYITPVPGGVGPMTIAMLLTNTMKACKIQNGIQ
ncbi:MAG: bifunctional 5,10-methylenetetrahydrofolate dehydrogenase/5,10-methenyltetrahydrofolate cyclohydrolase [candidate division Zixibacteria bacterium]|nr:bifunctional 5,10-methylenetetrahydrofolate dehydrogenase/5,10-methenyltetrahydrofolate cyclohydrolase [candidate division Zixibacteria bacterium]MBU1471358.1 bifunctional 5,10-methylenetetrahydrofolate dehydrogenase/5,10-methenyltetrahydrofolate cyclohydrolase [candidate division Zixibacteria bacterium]